VVFLVSQARRRRVALPGRLAHHRLVVFPPVNQAYEAPRPFSNAQSWDRQTGETLVPPLLYQEGSDTVVPGVQPTRRHL
jgi:hypothetical protein